MLKPSPQFLTPEEYLAAELVSQEKHEYWSGETYLMAGASINHNQIVGNVFLALNRNVSERPCRVFTTDLRLRVQSEDMYTYPDVMVICDSIETDPRQQDTVMNPQLIVEVWSDSTMDIDRGNKFKSYRKIPSLNEYVMIDQSAPYIEYYRREGRFWVLQALEGIDAILYLSALECEISLQEIYQRVEWKTEQPQPRKSQRKS